MRLLRTALPIFSSLRMSNGTRRSATSSDGPGLVVGGGYALSTACHGKQPTSLVSKINLPPGSTSSDTLNPSHWCDWFCRFWALGRESSAQRTGSCDGRNGRHGTAHSQM